MFWPGKSENTHQLAVLSSFKQENESFKQENDDLRRALYINARLNSNETGDIIRRYRKALELIGGIGESGWEAEFTSEIEWAEYTARSALIGRAS